MTIQELDREMMTLKENIEKLMLDVGYTDTTYPDAISPGSVEWDHHNPDDRLLMSEYSQMINNLVGIKRLIEYLHTPVNAPERIKKEGGNYCSTRKKYYSGDRVEWLNEHEDNGEQVEEWQLSYIDYDGTNYTLLGSSKPLEGLLIRERGE